MTQAMRFIASRDNPDFRLWLRLAQGRPGHHDTRVILEGENLCRAWLDLMGPPLALIIGESTQAQSRGRIKSLWQSCQMTRRVVLQDNLAAVMSQVRHGPAIFFLVDTPQPRLPQRLDQGCLWLDRIQDPGNVGTLLRTAAAAGLKQVFLSTACARAWSPKVLRSAQGAHFALQIYEQLDLPSLLPRLDIPLAVTIVDTKHSIYKTDLRPPCAWVMGNEGQGVDSVLLQAARLHLRIPQDDGVDSLNVAAAAAICLFEQRRQQLYS